jgi:hypothetical protein
MNSAADNWISNNWSNLPPPDAFPSNNANNTYLVTIPGGKVDLAGNVTIDQFKLTNGELNLLHAPNGFTFKVLGYAAFGFEGNEGHGAVVHSGGTLDVGSGNAPGPRSLVIGSAGSSGSYTFSGGSIVARADEVIGIHRKGEFRQSGTTTHEVKGNLRIGLNSAGTLFELTGGTLTVTGDVEVAVGEKETTVFTQEGGTHTISGTLRMGLNRIRQGMNTVSLAEGKYVLTGGQMTVERMELGRPSLPNTLGGEGRFELGTWVQTPIGQVQNGTGVLTVNNVARLGGSEGTAYFRQTHGEATFKGDLLLGGDRGSGEYYADGGTARFMKNLIMGAEGGTSAYNQYGGTVEIAGNMLVGTAQPDARRSDAKIGTGSLTALNLTVERSGTFFEFGPILEQTPAVLTVEKRLTVRGDFVQFGGLFNVDEIDSKNAEKFEQLGGEMHWIGMLFRGDAVVIAEDAHFFAEGANRKRLEDVTFQNSATMTVGDDITITSSDANIQNGREFNLRSDSNLLGTGSITNDGNGTFRQSGAGASSRVELSFTDHHSNIDVQGDGLELAGDFTVKNYPTYATTKLGPGTLVVSGGQSHEDGATLVVSAGSLQLKTDAGSAGAGGRKLNLALEGSAAAQFDTSQHLKSLAMSGSATTVKLKANGSYVIEADSILAPLVAGAIDIADNQMSGFMVAAEESWYEGVVTSSELGGSTTAAMDVGFDGTTFRFTFAGDVNLDGSVNAADLAMFDAGGGWRDFDRDHDEDGDDRQVVVDAINAGVGSGSLNGTQTLASSTHWLLAGSTMSIGGAGGKTLDNAAIRNSGGTVTWSGGDIALSNASRITNSGVFDVRTDGTISASGTGTSQFVNQPNGVLRKSLGGGTSTVSAGYVHEGGSIDVQTGTIALSGAVSIGEGATLLKTGGGALVISGTQSHGAYSTIHASAGALTVNSDAGPAYPGSPTTGLKLSGGAGGTLNSTQHLSSLHVGTSSVVTVAAGRDKLVRSGGLSFDGTAAAPLGKLDLKDNAMIVDGGVLLDVRASIKAGWNNPTKSFTGQGVGTSIGVDCDGRSMALGYAQGSDALTLHGLLASEGHGDDSVLVRQTYQGDADLDGDVDGDDAARHVWTGELGNPVVPVALWTSGDWDYDGDGDGEDLGVWSLNFTGELNGGDPCGGGGSLMMGEGGFGESYALSDASQFGDYSYNGIDLLLPLGAHPAAVEILRAMGYGVGGGPGGVAKAVPEPGVVMGLGVAAVLAGWRRQRRAV